MIGRAGGDKYGQRRIDHPESRKRVKSQNKQLTIILKDIYQKYRYWQKSLKNTNDFLTRDLDFFIDIHIPNKYDPIYEYCFYIGTFYYGQISGKSP